MHRLDECLNLPEPKGSPRDRARSHEVLDIWQDYKNGRIDQQGFHICLAIHTLVGEELGEFGYKQLPRMNDKKLESFRKMSPEALEKMQKVDEYYYLQLAEKAKSFREEQERIGGGNISEAKDLRDSGRVLVAAHEEGLGDFSREMARLQKAYRAYQNGWKTDPVILKRAEDRAQEEQTAPTAARGRGK